METNIKPKFGRVLIKREIKEKVGSIIIPESMVKRHAACRGIIVGLGETAGYTDTYFQSHDGLIPQTVQTLNIGDEVIFGRHSGAWLDATESDKGENDDGTLFICQDQDILAVIFKQTQQEPI